LSIDVVELVSIVRRTASCQNLDPFGYELCVTFFFFFFGGNFSFIYDMLWIFHWSWRNGCNLKILFSNMYTWVSDMSALRRPVHYPFADPYASFYVSFAVIHDAVVQSFPHGIL
jgi:hypothetical protein